MQTFERGIDKFIELNKLREKKQVRFKKLPDLDSNQDKQNQNLSYYHYTIGQHEYPGAIF
jgi:hypothetical protein